MVILLDKFEIEVVNSLRQLEIPANLVGYQFIKTALSILNENHSAIHAVIKLYEAVAEIEGTTASRVERGIRNAIGVAECDSLTWKRVLGTARKLANSEFLATLAESISIRLATNKENGVIG